MRGLKHDGEFEKTQQEKVASYTGAWIETPKLLLYLMQVGVASYTGAWIETTKRIYLTVE